MFIRFFTFFSLLFLPLSSTANLFDAQPKYLTSDQAFDFSYQYASKQLQLNWQIADGYYLYKKEITAQSNTGDPIPLNFPDAETHNDDFFGLVEIFRNQLTLQLPIENLPQTSEIEIHYQGCTKGFCYPPETVKIPIQAVSFDQKMTSSAENSPSSPTEQNKLATALSDSHLSIFWFFILGLGLAFTPCVLPMLPLLSAIVIGSRQRPNNIRAFTLSFTYVQGMALTYTLLGLLVASIGLPFQVALQSPPVLIGLSIIFTLLALSMFGLFTLELPYRWQQALNNFSQKQQGGSYPSVFVMGMIAGLVASPCTSAPLSGALLYVAQSGDLFTGGLALYLLALGMGLPLLLITIFGNNILPKSGDWLLKVKILFGFVMLALPIFLLTRLLPAQYEALLWSALGIAVLAWLYEQFQSNRLWKKGLKILLLILLALTTKPWTDLIWQTDKNQIQTQTFQRITTLTELEQQLSAHKGQKVMLDLYADWCVACKEFEHQTFSDQNVKDKLNNLLVLQVDMTKNSTENKAIMEHFHILGLPTILFFDENGNELSQSRITGFMPAKPFLAHLDTLNKE